MILLLVAGTQVVGMNQVTSSGSALTVDSMCAFTTASASISMTTIAQVAVSFIGGPNFASMVAPEVVASTGANSIASNVVYQVIW